MSLTDILVAAASGDASVRGPAESHLVELEQRNLPQYLAGMCAELANPQSPTESRQLAGLMLKNALVAKNEATQRTQSARWAALDGQVRAHIRSMLLQLLSNQTKTIRDTAALVIGKVAAIEVPNNQWPQLITSLVASCQSSDNAALRQASFEALGYVCEELPNQLHGHSNDILNAIASGMAVTQPLDVKLSATHALSNSLEFIKANFENESERNMIMQMIFSVVQNPSQQQANGAVSDAKLKTAALQCLVEIATQYYKHLAPYMTVIFQLTSASIQANIDSRDANDGAEEVAQQAVEFWSTVCDQESALAADAEYLRENPQDANPPPQTEVSQHFVRKAQPHLLPMLLSSLCKQNDEIDDDTWNTAQAAGTCLGLCAQILGSSVTNEVLPFVQTNITSNEWRKREAALLAFGAMLSCAEEAQDRTDSSNDAIANAAHAELKQLSLLVQQALPLILKHMSDSNALVKDTAAWAIGRICNLLPVCIVPVLPQLMTQLMQGLQDVPRVASNVCWAIHNLAEGLDQQSKTPLPTAPLSPYFESIMQGLMQTTMRQDVSESNLLASAYEAINVLIMHASPVSHPLIAQLLPMFLQRLHETLSAASMNNAQREYVNEIQALLCSAIQIIIQKLPDEAILPYTDQMMSSIFGVLQSKHSTVHEEALMACGALAARMNGEFNKYVAHLKPILLQGLQAAQEHKVCMVCVGLVGDLARALDQQFIPLGDDVMKIMLEHLRNVNIERDIKPQVISCIGDIALATGGYFQRYLQYCMPMMVQASQFTLEGENDTSEEMQEYVQELREAVLEAYTGILQGLSADGFALQFIQVPNLGLEPILQFLDMLASDPNAFDSVMRCAAGFIGDLGSRLAAQVSQPLLSRPSIAQIIQRAAASDNSATRDNAQWAQSVLSGLQQQPR